MMPWEIGPWEVLPRGAAKAFQLLAAGIKDRGASSGLWAVSPPSRSVESALPKVIGLGAALVGALAVSPSAVRISAISRVEDAGRTCTDLSPAAASSGIP